MDWSYQFCVMSVLATNGVCEITYCVPKSWSSTWTFLVPNGPLVKAFLTCVVIHLRKSSPADTVVRSVVIVEPIIQCLGDCGVELVVMLPLLRHRRVRATPSCSKSDNSVPVLLNWPIGAL